MGLACIFGDTDEQALVQVPEGLRPFMSFVALVGSPATIRQRIAEYEEAGAQKLLFRFPEPLNLDPIRRFALEFIA